LNNIGASFSSSNVTWRDVCSHKKPPFPAWTHYVTRNLALPIVYVCAKLHITPNMVTTISLLTGIAAVVVIAIKPNNTFNIIAFGVLLQLSYAMDSADGTLARVTGCSSKFGAWYDLVIDRFLHITIVGSVMIVMLPITGSQKDFTLHCSFYIIFLAVTLTYCNARNLKAAMMSRGLGGNSNKLQFSSMTNITRRILDAVCDYGFLLFCLFMVLLTKREFLIIGSLIAFYSVAIIGLIYILWRQDSHDI